MAPGRYRAIEHHSRARTEPFEVVSGKTAEVTFDLTKVGHVRGTVRVPEGLPLTGLQVGPDGPPPPTGQAPGVFRGGMASPLVRVDPKTGEFAYRVSGTEEITLRVFHKTLRPHPTRGRITVRGPQEGPRAGRGGRRHGNPAALAVCSHPRESREATAREGAPIQGRRGEGTGQGPFRHARRSAHDDHLRRP